MEIGNGNGEFHPSVIQRRSFSFRDFCPRIPRIGEQRSARAPEHSKLWLENRLTEGGTDEAHGECCGLVAVVEDRIDFDHFDRAEPTALVKHLHHEVRFAVAQSCPSPAFRCRALRAGRARPYRTRRESARPPAPASGARQLHHAHHAELVDVGSS